MCNLSPEEMNLEGARPEAQLGCNKCDIEFVIWWKPLKTALPSENMGAFQIFTVSSSLLAAKIGVRQYLITLYFPPRK